MASSRHLSRLAERGAEELRVALESIAEAARSGTGFGAALVSRVDGEDYEVLAMSVEEPVGLKPGEKVPLSETLCSRVVAEGSCVQLPDARSADGRARLLGLGAYAGVPLRRLDGSLFGTLAVCDRDAQPSVSAEVEFLEKLARLATHEIGLHDSLQRLVEEATTDDTEHPHDLDDPVGDLQGLGAVVAAVLHQTSAHDNARLRRMLARETNQFAHDLLDTLMRHRHLSMLPGNLEPWGTEVDKLLARGGSLLPGDQGARIVVHANSGAVADIPRRHLERILVNLVYRAWRVSPPPSAITLSSRLRPGAVEIGVEDLGPALEAESADRIFDDEGRGLLGLSVVKELATGAGGSVRYECNLTGNKLVVRLPLAGAPRGVSGG